MVPSSAFILTSGSRESQGWRNSGFGLLRRQALGRIKGLADEAVLGQDVKVRDAIRRLVEDGWVQVAQKGSHRQFKHATKRGKVTVPGKPSDDLPVGTYRSILRQAGLEE
jgi:predicted RNA binding protein YcfA (HicA-like mRNA interferase family)